MLDSRSARKLNKCQIMIIKLKDTNISDIINLIKDVIKGMLNENIDQWDEIYPNSDVIISDINTKSAYGYFNKNKLIGYIAINSVFSPEYQTVNWKDKDGKFLVIHRLCVNTNSQGKGIGKQLLKICGTICRN